MSEGNPLAIGNFMMAVEEIGSTRWQKFKRLMSIVWYVIKFVPTFYWDVLKNKNFYLNWGKSFVFWTIILVLGKVTFNGGQGEKALKEGVTWMLWGYGIMIPFWVTLIGTITGIQMWFLDESVKKTKAFYQSLTDGILKHFEERERIMKMTPEERKVEEQKRWTEYARRSHQDRYGFQDPDMADAKK